MKKLVLVLCAVCLMAGTCFALTGCGSKTPTSVEGKTYQFVGASLQLPEDITAEKRTQLETGFRSMKESYKNLSLEQILEELEDELLAGYQQVKPCFVFKENGVLESVYELDGEKHTDVGTYELKDGTLHLVEDGVTLEAKLSGKHMYIEQNMQGLICVLKLVQG